MLGPLLFISIYINDIGSGVTSNISKFADDIKIGCTIRTGKMPGHYKRTLINYRHGQIGGK